MVEAARRRGYLEWDPARKRYTRSGGEQYSDMVGNEQHRRSLTAPELARGKQRDAVVSGPAADPNVLDVQHPPEVGRVLGAGKKCHLRRAECPDEVIDSGRERGRRSGNYRTTRLTLPLISLLDRLIRRRAPKGQDESMAKFSAR